MKLVKLYQTRKGHTRRVMEMKQMANINEAEEELSLVQLDSWCLLQTSVLCKL
jgi:hypothetical protein